MSRAADQQTAEKRWIHRDNFRGVDPNDLPGLLRREDAARTRWKRYLLGGGDGLASP